MRVDTELEAFEGLATTWCRKRTSTVALPSNQVEAGVMIRPVPPQACNARAPSSTISAARSPARRRTWQIDRGVGETKPPGRRR
jgi:hypothetical protein